MPDQKVIHLANVLAIAEADGAVDSAEAAVFEVIAARLGATAADIAAARLLLAQNQPYRLRDPGVPAAAMAVIEDMVMMSMADGKVKPKEARALEEYCERLGYVQADIDMVVRRVRPRLDKLDPAAVTATSPAKPPPLPPPLPRATPAARPAPARARPTPPPTPPVRQADAAYSAPPSSGATPPAAHPQPPPPAAERSAPLPAPPPLEWQVCAGCRKQAAAGEAYCFGAPGGPLNPWGCRLLNMPWQEAAWLRLGSFRADGAFFFDRAAIAAMLAENQQQVVSCPYLRPGFAEAALAEMPRRAAVDGNWLPHEARDGAEVARLAVCDYAHGCSGRRELAVDGLVPASNHFALRMIRRAARRTSFTLDMKLLNNLEDGGGI